MKKSVKVCITIFWLFNHVFLSNFLVCTPQNPITQQPGFLCTGIRLIAQNGAVVYGRTMEFAKNIESEIIVVPRNYAFVGTVPSGASEGLRWKSRYAVVGANVCHEKNFVDGVNESGLAGGLFYFSDYAEYQDVRSGDLKQSIAPYELLTWILTTCATVEEVKKKLPTIKVTKTIFKPWNFIPPIHAIVHDAQGKSVVIEYVAGKLHLYDNPLGVITNSPTFDWHLTNLKNYSTIFDHSLKKLELCNVHKVPMKGSGCLGIPGDFSSTSRFVRAVFYSQSIMVPAEEHEMRDVLFHILNLFDIPVGIERYTDGCSTMYDYTQWTSVHDLKNRRFYFRTYENPQIHSVDLMRCDLNAKKISVIPMKISQKIVDLTPH